MADSPVSRERAHIVHANSLVVDLVSPLMGQLFDRAVDDYRAGGVSAVGATVSDPSSHGVDADLAIDGLRGVARLRNLIRANSSTIQLVETAADFQSARESQRLGIFLHFQNSTYFERNLDLVEVFYAVGVRIAQLAYNVRSFAADGCVEAVDGGLSRFGRLLVAEMNRVGMIVDGAHCGSRSSLEAIEASTAPVVFSHVSCKALVNHPRAITDDQIRACAASGGVVGIVGLPYLLGDWPERRLDTLVRHISHAVEVAGIDHVAIGLDYHSSLGAYRGAGHVDTDVSAPDLWNPGDRPSEVPDFPPQMLTPASLQNLTRALLEAGFRQDEIAKLWGENFVRVCRAVWNPADAGDARAASEVVTAEGQA